MQLIKYKDLNPVYKNPVVTIGVFDGVHMGHREIIKKVIDRAKKINGISFILTFHPHPEKILKGTSPPLLTTKREKIELLKSLGIDYVVIIPFTKTFSALFPDQFIYSIYDKLNPKEIIVGFNFLFGCDKIGNVLKLKKYSKIYDYTLHVVNPKTVNDKIVSSSLIRELLKSANINAVKELLGYYPIIFGKVKEGCSRGRIIGFRTANLKIDKEKLLPKDGVYAAIVELGNKKFYGVVNIGIRPTFDEENKTQEVEVHIIDFNKQIYGEYLKLHLIKRIRAEKKFKNIQKLKKQIEKDVNEVKKLFAID